MLMWHVIFLCESWQCTMWMRCEWNMTIQYILTFNDIYMIVHLGSKWQDQNIINDGRLSLVTIFLYPL